MNISTSSLAGTGAGSRGDLSRPEDCTRPPLWGREYGTTAFVGGVSDGRFGVAVYDMDHDSTQAKKAWFMFDDEIVCLAAGISGMASDTVGTTLNQTLRETEVWIKEPGRKAHMLGNNTDQNESVEWIWAGSTGYIVPGKQQVRIGSHTIKGDWSEIGAFEKGTYETKNILEIYKPHGIRPDNTSFAYILVPGMSLDSFRKYDATATDILANSNSLQMVRNIKLDIYGVVLFETTNY